MKLYDGWMKAFEKRDFDEVMKYYHRDYSFVRHQTNTIMIPKPPSVIIIPFTNI